MSITLDHCPSRPASSPETLRHAGAVEAPLVALFENMATAEAALLTTGAELLRHRSPGVVMLMPRLGLRESLYAAGALLVVG